MCPRSSLTGPSRVLDIRKQGLLGPVCLRGGTRQVSYKGQGFPSIQSRLFYVMFIFKNFSFVLLFTYLLLNVFLAQGAAEAKIIQLER